MLELQSDNFLFEERLTLFAEVLLPLAVTGTFTYRIPFELNNQIMVGQRVVVQFGANKVYTALVHGLTSVAPSLYEAKYILSLLDEAPVITPMQLTLWTWLSSYYMCHLGEVMAAALPSAMKLASETKITLNPESDLDKGLLDDKEFLVVDALDLKKELSISDVMKVLGIKTIMPTIKKLREKEIILLTEELRNRYRPKTESYIQLHPDFHSSDRLKELFNVLERAPKQVDLLMTYRGLARNNEEVGRKQLLEESGCSATVLKTLLEKEVFLIDVREVSRFSALDLEEMKTFTLSAIQEQAFATCIAGFEAKKPVLLHGVTASGKTQVYIKLIERCLQNGKQALFLLPEIALTAQMIQRLQACFGDQVGIYHSKFNDNERAEVWKRTLEGKYRIVLGARSALFLPFQQLGLVIVDEEHESSYKQHDPAPRYHARDAALYLAQLFKADIVLGSATPSIESYAHAKAERYRLVELMERYGGVQLPEVQAADMQVERKQKSLKSHCSKLLFSQMEGALERKEQIILFQNRRGYAPLLTCHTCGYTSKCINCDISLTFHKHDQRLHCHYCGYKTSIFFQCPSCGDTRMEQKGFGTEKIEDELAILFPTARISRMDLDTTRNRNSYQQLITDFEEGRTDILVGTQMVTKGLDFANVSLIGILNADAMLNFPDFRAFERSFQLMTQVSGRAGRRDHRGLVIIQTANPKHKVIDWVMQSDFQSFFRSEMAERQTFNYPPFHRLIQLDVRHKEQEQVNASADMLAAILRQALGARVLGPEAPLTARIKNQYIKSITLKVEREGVSMPKVKTTLREAIKLFFADGRNKNSQIRIDVDPS